MTERRRPRVRWPSLSAWRVRLVAVSLALVALALAQSPGRIATDTKLDLTVDPGGFLARALSMWDPEGAFGQVQNQAYGYLFPMGPFFLGGHALRVDPWVVQRLWWAMVLVLAFLGMVKLAGAMGIVAPWARVVAGVAYALSPRILTVIGPSSIEVWPMALAPWVLVPLVIGLRRGDPRWLAATSALAVAGVGGVNAVATFAVIPLGALWLVLAPPGPRRRALMIWWPVFTLLGTLWWLVPLFTLGSFSPPFLDYIESASNTTFTATLVDAVRGTTNWVPYVDANSVAGNLLLRTPVLILDGLVLAGLGLVGVAQRGTPHRRFLFAGVLLGLVLVTLGHTGAVAGWGAQSIQHALDGVLAPLRNTHKFDVVLRIPLAHGLAQGLSLSGSALARVRENGRPAIGSLGSAAVAFVGILAVVGATVPAWSGQLTPRGSFTEVPHYWEEASAWLAEHDTGARALAVPAQPFGDYLWGRTGDDVLQPLASSPWATRNVVPLAPGGNIRALDDLEQRLATGQGSAGLARSLRRAGISYLVVRNDLAASATQEDPELFYSTLASTPGVRPVASFGPVLGGDDTTLSAGGATIFVKDGRQSRRPAIEIFAVGDVRGPARVQNESDTPVVVGGTTSLVDLDDIGALGDRDAILVGDRPSEAEPSHVVLTDGERRQEAAFSRVDRNRSASMTAHERYTVERRVHDYSVAGTDGGRSVRRLDGARSVTASSSGAWASAPGPLDPGAQPFSALDGDPRTAWRATGTDQERSWLEVDLGERRSPRTVTVLLAGSTGAVTRRLTVSTDAGEVRATATSGEARTITLPSGSTGRLRVSAPATPLLPLAISELQIDGVAISRPLVLPTLPKGWRAPEEILLAAGSGYRTGCIDVGRLARCTPGADSWGEDGRSLDRVLNLPGAGSFTPSLEVAPVGGAAFDALVQQGRLTAVSASSYRVEAAENSVVRTIDGDAATGWVASADDRDPALTLSWEGDRVVDRIRIDVDGSLAASVARSVRLRFSDGTTRVARIRDGVARFAPVRAGYVTVYLDDVQRRLSVDAGGSLSPLPVGVSEISIPGTRLFPVVPDTAERAYACGTGPEVTIDGTAHQTRLASISPADLLGRDSSPAQVCGSTRLRLDEGTHRVQVAGNDAVRPVSLLLKQPSAPASTIDATDSTERAVSVNRHGPTARTLSLPTPTSEDRLVTVAENANPGWRSSDDEPVVVNGWQQGWLAKASVRSVDVAYAPQKIYLGGLGVGSVTLAVLLAFVALRRRRPRRDGAARGVARPRARLAAGAAVGVVVALLGGWPGLLAAVVGAVAVVVVRPKVGDEIRPWLALLPFAVATLGYVLRPWGGSAGWVGDDAWPQLAVLVTLGALAAEFFEPPTRWRKRWAGSSTTR